MTIINRYIGTQVIQSILIVVIGLLGIDLFFYLINELRFVGKGNYNLSTAILFVALTIPRKIYIMFPWSALIGTLLALGNMARHSELVAMRASSISMRQISIAVLQAALIVTIIVATFGEVVSPYSERLAQRTKTLALSQGQAVQTQFGTWVRHENDFVHVGTILSDGKLHNITRYELNPDQTIKEAIIAQTAYREDGHWVLENIRGTKFNSDHTKIIQEKKRTVPELLDQDILSTSGVKHLERLSMRHLWLAIKSRAENELNTQDYQLALWTKIIQPFAILVMVFLAIPFAFGPLRSASMGLKLLVGILVGFSFHTLNQIFAPLTMVASFPPILAAALPTLCFFVAGIWLMRRVR